MKNLPAKLSKIFQLKTAFLVTLTACLTLAGCQQNNTQTDCGKIRRGKFHLHSETTGHDYIIERQLYKQTEIDVTNSDTSYFDVTWKEDCFYLLKFKSGAKTVSDDYRKFMLENNVTVKVLVVNDKYYVCETGTDAPGITQTVKDTLFIDYLK